MQAGPRTRSKRRNSSPLFCTSQARCASCTQEYTRGHSSDEALLCGWKPERAEDWRQAMNSPSEAAGHAQPVPVCQAGPAKISPPASPSDLRCGWGCH